MLVDPARLGSVRRVAVLRALKLGDLLVAIPALRALRRAVPRADIALIGLPWAREFVDRFPHLIDVFHEFAGWPGLPEMEPRLAEIPTFIARMQRERFDLVLQMHGSGSIVNELCALLAPRRVAGFFRAGDFRPEPRWFLPWPETGLELRRLLALTEFLGFPTCGEQLEFPLNFEDFDKASALTHGLREYVCIHPGASVAERRWPIHGFAQIADILAARGYPIVLTGSEGECELTQAVARSMTAPALDLAGKTDLGAAAALLRRARLLVANDTGVSHLAAAVRTRSVIVSTGDNPARWSPLNERLHRVLCAKEGIVPVAAVARAAIDLLKRRHRPAHSDLALCGPSAS